MTTLLKENLKNVLEKIELKVKELEDLINEKNRIEAQLKVEDDRESKPDIFAERKELCDIDDHDELRNLLSLNKSSIRLLTGRGIKTPERSRDPTPDKDLNRSKFSNKQERERSYQDIKATTSMTAYRVGDQNKYEEQTVRMGDDDDYDDYEYDHEAVQDETPQLHSMKNYVAQNEAQQSTARKRAGEAFSFK